MNNLSATSARETDAEAKARLLANMDLRLDDPAQSKFDAESPEQALDNMEDLGDEAPPRAPTQDVVPTYYAGVTPEIVAEIERDRDEARKGNAATGKLMLHTGNRLRAIKEKLPHGQFGPWLAAEMPEICDRTARFYMQAAEYVDANSNRKPVSDLPMTIIGLLASPSTPQAAREDILERVEDGERVSKRDAEKTIRKHKAANDDAKSDDADGELDADAEAALEDAEKPKPEDDRDGMFGAPPEPEPESSAEPTKASKPKVTKPTKPTKPKTLAEIVKRLVAVHTHRAVQDELDKLAAAGKPKLTA